MTFAVRRSPILLSIAAALATLGLKLSAYRLTDSVSLLTEAIEGVGNLIAALIAFGCLWYAAQPVDSTHTYGHEKIEFFSSGLEGMLILLAAAGMGWYAVQRLFKEVVLESIEFGALLAGIAALVNLAVALRPDPHRPTHQFHRARSRRAAPDDRCLDDRRRPHRPDSCAADRVELDRPGGRDSCRRQHRASRQSISWCDPSTG